MGLRLFYIFLAACFLLLCASCSRTHSEPRRGEVSSAQTPGEEPDLAEAIDDYYSKTVALTGGQDVHSNILAKTLRMAETPEYISNAIQEAVIASPAFIMELLMCLGGDPWLRKLVDKLHPLPSDYEPDDLVVLGGDPPKSYRVNRPSLTLRKAAADSLEEMAAAALADGVTLVASSAYRSYSYQDEVYSRIVRQMGQAAADRESARPGHSQHQTGLVLDFGSIDDSFAQTAAGLWMAANAPRFGWSLSFPDGYENVTGYRWESWHFRYLGKDLAAFINRYFDGIQQYGLRFIHEWESHSD